MLPRMNRVTSALWLSLIVLGSIVQFSECTAPKEKFRILGVFSHQGKSHFDVFKPLLEELARRGHDVTVVSFFPRANASANYRDISLVDSDGVYVDVVDLNVIGQTFFTLSFELGLISQMGQLACEKSLNNPEVLSFIESGEKFDLILTEVFNSDCFLGFVHKFKAPFVGMSSHVLMPWSARGTGNPHNPSFIPALFSGLSQKMTFYERAKNFFAHSFANAFYQFLITPPIERIVGNTFGEDRPLLANIAGNMSAIFVNSHSSLHGSRPLMPNVIEVGGMHVPDGKPLARHIKDFLDDAPKGVLYFSWGSMIKASTMSEDMLNVIINVLGKLPQKVIWKWEVENLPRKPKNVMIQKWLPQYDVLRHPNVKGYLAHGGLLGLTEAVHCGVPLVIVPVFGDQHCNAAAAASRGMAVVLGYDNITETSLGEALDKILNDPSYTENAKKVSKAFRDRPMTPLETAVWWTEYFARNKGQPLMRSEAAELSWIQYHLLDVFAFILGIAIVALLVIGYAIKISLSWCLGGKVTSKPHSPSRNGLANKKRA